MKLQYSTSLSLLMMLITSSLSAMTKGAELTLPPEVPLDRLQPLALIKKFTKTARCQEVTKLARLFTFHKEAFPRFKKTYLDPIMDKVRKQEIAGALLPVVLVQMIFEFAKHNLASPAPETLKVIEECGYKFFNVEDLPSVQSDICHPLILSCFPPEVASMMTLEKETVMKEHKKEQWSLLSTAEQKEIGFKVFDRLREHALFGLFDRAKQTKDYLVKLRHYHHSFRTEGCSCDE